MGGGEMIREVHLRRTTFNDVPWKFEAGTPDIAAAIGLGAALEYLDGVGMDRVARPRAGAHRVRARRCCRARCRASASTARATAAERAGIVTFNLPGIHAHDVATLLDREAIAIRAGHHCTQPLHERLGESATARASFNVYSVTDDLDRLAAGLRKVQRIFGGDARSRSMVAAVVGPRTTLPAPCRSAPAQRPAAPS